MKLNRRALISSTVISLFLLSGCNSGTYHYRESDVSSQLEKAEQMYQGGDYENALSEYLDAMQEEPKSSKARLGAIKCEMILEDYENALSDLQLAIQIAPDSMELYEQFLILSEKTGEFETAQMASDYAKQYGQEEFLSAVPGEPEISLAAGRYAEKQTVEITTEDPEASIYYSLSNSDKRIETEKLPYRGPIRLAGGETTLRTFTVKNGVASGDVVRRYNIEYEPAEIQFADPAVEQEVRSVLHIPTKPLTDKDLESVTELSFNNEIPVHTLEDIRNIPYLEEIQIYNTMALTDYSPLADCQYLMNGQFYNTGLTSVQFISDYMPGLMYLDIQSNAVADISPLLQCRYLYELRLDDKNISGDILMNLKHLESLDILGYSFDSEAVRKLKGLTRLSLDYNGDWNNRFQVMDLTFLESLTNLEYLYISYLSDASQLSHLYPLKNLQDLHISNIDEEKWDYSAEEKLRQQLPNCSISL